MSDMNVCIFTGRLGADPEVRCTQAGKSIVNLRLAVSDSWRDKQSGERKERTEWIQVVIFNEGIGRVAEQYLRKGSRIAIQGSWQTRKWQDQSGNDRYSTECVIQAFGGSLTMLDGPSQDRGERRDEPARQSGGHGAEMDDDIPFAPEWRG